MFVSAAAEKQRSLNRRSLDHRKTLFLQRYLGNIALQVSYQLPEGASEPESR